METKTTLYVTAEQLEILNTALNCYRVRFSKDFPVNFESPLCLSSYAWEQGRKIDALWDMVYKMQQSLK